MSALRNKNNILNNSDDIGVAITSKQEEIDGATRDAYLFAMGMIIIVLSVTFVHAWGFYLAQNIGMQMRIIATGAIYHKVNWTLNGIQLLSLFFRY